MDQPVANPRIVRFGLFEVDLETRELRKSGLRIKVQDQPFQILAMLLARPGTIVTREELQKKLWPSETFVDFDLSLNSAVKKLRQALNDDSENPRFVETLYRRGYRFIGAVEATAGIEQFQPAKNTSDSPNPAGSSAVAAESSPAQKPNLVLVTAAVVSVVVALGAISLFWLRAPLSPRVLSTTQLTSDNLPKDDVMTDGPRVYFTETLDEHVLLSQVSANGGEISHISTPFTNSFLLAVSPLRSELLIDSGNDEGILGTGQAAPWIVPVPAGSPRRVGDFLVNAATWSRDGKELAYSRDHDIYLAKWDGTQSHKLITTADICRDLQFSPDAKHLRFTVSDMDFRLSLWEIALDGAGLRQLLPGFHQAGGECCGRWSADGRYYFFVAFRNGRSDIWALRETAGVFRPNSPAPLPITAGPLAYFSPAPALADDRLFVIGEQQRAQLQRLDTKSQQFVPFLNGISAGEIDFSRDRKWVTYVSYPDSLLWRSRVDGTEKLQLTYPPLNVSMPRWSPDDRQIVYVCESPGKIQTACIISAGGGATEEVQIDGQQRPDDPQWAPDGRSLILALYPPGLASTKSQDYSVGRFDLQAKKITVLPGSEGMLAPRWSPDGRYISTVSVDGKKAMLLGLSSGKWSELATGSNLQYPNWSLDSKYAYFEDLGEDGPEIDRVSVPTRKKERVAVLKGIPRVPLLGSGSPWNGVAPDGSPLIMRDLGIRELYSLTLQLP